MKTEIGTLLTEKRNPRTLNMDQMDSLTLVRTIVNEEKRVVPAILKADKQLARAVDLYVDVMENGGRIIITGSGCSGTFATLDVEELDATFSVKAFGDDPLNEKIAALHSQRGWQGDNSSATYLEFHKNDMLKRDISEDSLTQAHQDLEAFKFSKNDLIICITASGRSPLIVDLAKEAKKRHGKVIAIVNNYQTEIKQYSDVIIEAVIGEPPLTGSGRMVAGTTSKIVLTTLSTAAFTKLGKVYSNLMVDLNVKDWFDNSKFVNRAIRIVASITNCELAKAKIGLEKANWNIKLAALMIVKNISLLEAKTRLKANKQNLRKALLQK